MFVILISFVAYLINSDAYINGAKLQKNSRLSKLFAFFL